jgi:hypothetical protein
MNIINAHGFEHAVEPAALYIYNAERSVKGGILKKWRKGLYDTFVLCSKKVQLSLMP